MAIPPIPDIIPGIMVVVPIMGATVGLIPPIIDMLAAAADIEGGKVGAGLISMLQAVCMVVTGCVAARRSAGWQPAFTHMARTSPTPPLRVLQNMVEDARSVGAAMADICRQVWAQAGSIWRAPVRVGVGSVIISLMAG
ncbi:hypothetical protein HK101_009735 [Irineochytrium annulatum]|nr:hypothetical protein HK101_009735 [Irineochytrium annulatum]